MDASSYPRWVLAAAPALAIAAAFIAFIALDGPGLGDRRGPDVEDIEVERTELRPGEIQLAVRNVGPDPVTIAQVSVSDVYVDFSADPGGEIDRLGRQGLTLDYPWQEGSPYTIVMLTSTGGTIEHAIDVAVETPAADSGFFALMALLGTYVGIIPVALGMLFLPFIRTAPERVMRGLMAFTIGLLGFLALDGYIEGLEAGESSSGAFGGVELLFLGAGLSYLALTAVSRHMQARVERERSSGAGGYRLALLVATGIGLHNLGEGLAIGSAYAVGALALGAFLVIGFALHNTTEGLAIVAPLAREGERPPLGKLLVLGVVAGAPAILGAVIGASALNTELATFLLGAGVGAILQVIVQLAPTIRDRAGQALNPLSIAGIVAGALALYLTGLMVAL